MPTSTMTIQPTPTTTQSSGHHRRRSSYYIEPTNTLILTSLPKSFFHASVLQPLRAHFECYGRLHTWAPLKSFGRIIVVFFETDDAERLKTDCDGLHVGGAESELQVLRLYRGAHTETTVPDPETLHLQVPRSTKNFLISPPGSPPVGWEPIEEEPPNTSTLAADLIAALERVQSQQNSRREDGKQVLLDTQAEASPGSDRGVLVLLEDVDAPKGENGLRTPDEIVEYIQEPPRFSQYSPPRLHGRIGDVKATVESMRKIMPTAMPPRDTSEC